MKSLRILCLTVGVAAVAACVPRTPPPEPEPAPQPRPAPPAPPPPPPPAAADWRDMPLTPGQWTYRNTGGQSQALYGPAGGAGSFGIRCERASRQLTLSRAGTADARAITIRSTTGAKSFAATPQAGAAPYLVASVAPNDPALDAMVFSRGRFTVEAPGTTMLVIPSWPEPARVIEDCRA